jgi:hypothetical protein
MTAKLLSHVSKWPSKLMSCGANNIPYEWKDGSPAQATEGDPAGVCLSGRLVEDLPKYLEQDQTDDLQ